MMRVVEEHEDGISVVVTEERIGIVPASQEMHGLSVMDDVLAFPPSEEVRREIMQVSRSGIIGILRLARGGPSFSGEEVRLVLLPSSREINPLRSVIPAALAAGEHHLISVIDLRNAPHRRHEGHGHLHLRGIMVPCVSHPRMVVVGDEYHHLGKVMVHEIMRQAVIHPCKALSPLGVVPVLTERRGDGFLQREVHYRGKVGIEAVLVEVSSLPIRKLRIR